MPYEPDVEIVPDASETVEARWLTPTDAIRLHVEDALFMAPPTYLTLLDMCHFTTTDEIWTQAAIQSVEPIQPVHDKTVTPMEICLPTHANHPSNTPYLGCVSVSLHITLGAKMILGSLYWLSAIVQAASIPRTDWQVIEGRDPNRLVVKFHEESHLFAMDVESLLLVHMKELTVEPLFMQGHGLAGETIPTFTVKECRKIYEPMQSLQVRSRRSIPSQYNW